MSWIIQLTRNEEVHKRVGADVRSRGRRLYAAVLIWSIDARIDAQLNTAFLAVGSEADRVGEEVGYAGSGLALATTLYLHLCQAYRVSHDRLHSQVLYRGREGERQADVVHPRLALED